jgi:hypothetical protein
MRMRADMIDGWFKSSFCGSGGGSCVEVAVVEDTVAMRDSKDPSGPALIFTLPQWRAFVLGARVGEFELR